MQDEPDHQSPNQEASPKPGYPLGAVASVAIHVVVLGVILIGLPHSDPPQPTEETVSVEIVPPPEPEPEKPPEQPPAPKAEEPPPPPPPPPPPQDKPDPEKPETAMQTPVLRPAFQFGEKDSGPEKALDGDGAEAAKPEPAPPVPQETQAEAKPVEAPQEPPPPADTQTAEQVEKPAEAQPEIALPEVDTPANAGQGEALASVVPLPMAKPEKPADAERKPPAAQTKATLREARKLYSASASGEMVAMMAMAGVPREQRASQLCATELREQLKHSKERFDPEYLPNIRLQTGNVMQVDLAAFRASGVWYDIHYRCEVDGDATRVTSFQFAVGEKVPRSQWAARRFPVH